MVQTHSFLASFLDLYCSIGTQIGSIALKAMSVSSWNPKLTTRGRKWQWFTGSRLSCASPKSGNNSKPWNFMDISHDILNYVKYQSSHKYYIGESRGIFISFKTNLKCLSWIHMNKSDFISVFQTTLSDILMDEARYMKVTAVP